MTLRPVFVTLLACVALLSMLAPAQAGRVRGTPIGLTFNDATDQRFISDGNDNGFGVEYVSGARGVTATVDGAVLSAKCGAFRPAELARTFTLKLMDDAGCTPTTDPTTNSVANLTVTLLSGSFADANPAGFTADATLAVDYNFGKQVRSFRCDATNSPGSNNVTVTWVGDGTWTVSAGATSIGKLTGTGAKKGDPPVDLGCWFVPFSIAVRPV